MPEQIAVFVAQLRRNNQITVPKELTNVLGINWHNSTAVALALVRFKDGEDWKTVDLSKAKLAERVIVENLGEENVASAA